MASSPPNASLDEVVLEMHRIGAFRFGQFKLKSGITSPIYVDLRLLPSYPSLMRSVANLMWLKSVGVSTENLSMVGVPYTALPIATCIGIDQNLPVLIVRKERKEYGTGNMVEGNIVKGTTRAIVLEDVVTTGGSVLSTVQLLGTEGIVVDHAVVFLNREQGEGGRAKDSLASEGVDLRSVVNIGQVLEILSKNGKISEDLHRQVKDFFAQPQPQPEAPKKIPQLSFAQRAKVSKSEMGRKLLELMESKKTNLALAADVSNQSQLLKLADEVGPEIAVLKTHVDTLDDFEPSFIPKLEELAKKHNFFIFEDRKFADIGNTVKSQYSGGVYKIADWSHITNSHIVSGASSVASLKEVGLPKGRGLLLIAQMSTVDANTDTSTVSLSLNAARQHSDFVFGFISQERIGKEEGDEGFIYLTPGVHLQKEGDNKGQHYNTPHHVIVEKQCDVIIVGRGISEASNPAEEAKKYRDAGWKAYQSRLSQ